MHKNLIKSTIAMTVLALAASGCADMSATQRGTAQGAGIGAGLGAIIGATTGGGGGSRAAKGAAIGAAAGAVAGNIWSKRMEQQKQTMEQATQGTGEGPMNRAAPPQVAEHNANLLLAALPPHELAQMLPRLDQVSVEAGAVLSDPGDPIRQIYFPHDCLVSLLAVAEGRMTLEVGLVGREGMLGATVALGHDTTQVRAVVQRAGSAFRMDSADFRAEFARNPSLQRVLYRYTDNLLAQAIQIAVCSRFHVLEARLARSLLITRDRLQSDKFHLTHEFLAHALGVRRVGVTKAASALQQQGLIIYSRGNIEILDPEGLAAASCTCYEIVKDAGASAIATAFL